MLVNRTVPLAMRIAPPWATPPAPPEVPAPPAVPALPGPPAPPGDPLPAEPLDPVAPPVPTLPVVPEVPLVPATAVKRPSSIVTNRIERFPPVTRKSRVLDWPLKVTV
jgi:hypothetical protein